MYYDLQQRQSNSVDMDPSTSSPLIVRSDLTIKVAIKDPLFRPVIHRYLDTLVGNLKAAIHNINFYEVALVDPVVREIML